jgi:microsomal dipeptidase-like Zn-dependent dipeptidase
MSNYDHFVQRFGIKHMRVSRDYDYRTINYGTHATYNQTASYYADREELLEVEIRRSGFENLVNIEREYTRLWQDERDEAWLRKQYPALKDAFEKYQMLLALYK